MTAEQFTYWLQGFVEMHGECPSPVQWKQIKDHLQAVFVKVTPYYGPAYVPPVPPMVPITNPPEWIEPLRIIC